jgi:hypothetical protein
MGEEVETTQHTTHQTLQGGGVITMMQIISRNPGWAKLESRRCKTMGIKGLSQLIADRAAGAIVENEFKNYFGASPSVLGVGGLQTIVSGLSTGFREC